MHRCVDEKRFGVLFSAVLLLSFILCASSALAASAMVNVDVPTGTFKSIKLNRLPKGASIEVQIESTGSLFVAMVTSKGLLETSKPLFVGQVDRKLSFTVVIPAPDDYYLVIDNRKGAKDQQVALAVRATAPGQTSPPKKSDPL